MLDPYFSCKTKNRKIVRIFEISLRLGLSPLGHFVQNEDFAKMILIFDFSSFSFIMEFNVQSECFSTGEDKGNYTTSHDGTGRVQCK